MGVYKKMEYTMHCTVSKKEHKLFVLSIKILHSILTYDWLVNGHQGAFFFIVQSAFTYSETLLPEFVEFIVHLYVIFLILKQEENILLAKNFTSSGEEGQTLNFTFKSQTNFNWKKHYHSYKIEMLISTTIFYFFLIPKFSIIRLGKDYACKKIEKMVETGRHSRSKYVFKKWGLY